MYGGVGDVVSRAAVNGGNTCCGATVKASGRWLGRYLIGKTQVPGRRPAKILVRRGSETYDGN